jgi:regulator of protease activity HflC (stomatin/prohibitin superfamily)
MKKKEKKTMNKKGKSLFVIVPLLIIAVLFFMICCVEKIPRGYVGSVYSISGGTSEKVLTEGWKLKKPHEKVTEYSVATEQLLMTKKDTKESQGNESFNATCKDGVLNVDLEMSYHFEAEDIPTIAKRYRGLSGEEIVNTRIKSKVRTYVNEVTSEYTVLEAYMDKKSELNTELTAHLQKKLEPYGIVVESATLPRTEPDEAIKQAITERSKKAQEVEAAKQEQELQKIEAQTKLIKAQAEADAAIARAEGEAKANKLISDSLTDELLEQMEMEARLKHGWIEIQSGTVITDATDK